MPNIVALTYQHPNDASMPMTNSHGEFKEIVAADVRRIRAPEGGMKRTGERVLAFSTLGYDARAVPPPPQPSPSGLSGRGSHVRRATVDARPLTHARRADDSPSPRGLG